MGSVILRTEDLSRRFGSFVAVDRFSISVDVGEVFGLLGTNGAGKSTVIKMLITLLPPTSGRAEIAGFDIERQSAQVRAIIGYVPQMLSVDGTLTGRENLAVFAKLYGLPRHERETRVREALSYMGLADSADSLVRDYSGGMIRRLEIAQAVLHRPRILFLDEPTLGLDPLARAAVWERLEGLRSDYGTTIFLTTHYMDEAESVCTRVAIMQQGRLVVLGTPDELKAALGGAEVTMDDVFTHFTGGSIEARGDYRDTSRTRLSVHRLG